MLFSYHYSIILVIFFITLALLMGLMSFFILLNILHIEHCIILISYAKVVQQGTRKVNLCRDSVRTVSYKAKVVVMQSNTVAFLRVVDFR